MTIKELETSLGMTRANIRFYEQKGFLTPQRGENNYRIYSQEDVDTLRKIKLLRQLGLPLDTIRQVQQGAVPLDTALARRQLALEEERAELAWADRVCSAMRSDRAEYATLDAEKYLNALDRPAEGEGYFSLKKDSAPMVAYPWRRFFARWLDLFVYGLLWTAFGALVLRINLPDIWILRLLSTYLNYLTMLVVEPILLATWGYTPGKWIFGLQVRDRDGGKISWRDAKNRTWLVFAKGWSLPKETATAFPSIIYTAIIKAIRPVWTAKPCPGKRSAATPSKMRAVCAVWALWGRRLPCLS